MTRRNILHRALGSAATVAFLSIPAGSAFAQDPTAKDAIRTNLRREILIGNTVEPREETGWFGTNFRLHRKSGFAYTRHLKMAEKPFVFRVQGPVLRKQKALGLAFKIRF